MPITLRLLASREPVIPAENDCETPMTSVRRRTAAVGGALALTAGLLADKGSVLGADLPQTALLGAALGAVLALVPDRSVAGRMGGFLSGFFAAYVGYALRAGFLPDSGAGRAVAAVVVVALATGVSVATAGRAPLWAGLVGAGAMLGAYETTFTTDPTGFVTDSVTAVTTVLVCAALGLLVTSSLDAVLEGRSSAASSDPSTDETDLWATSTAGVPAPRAAVDHDPAVSQELSR